MLPTILSAFVIAISAIVAVDGGVVQRDGTFPTSATSSPSSVPAKPVTPTTTSLTTTSTTAPTTTSPTTTSTTTPTTTSSISTSATTSSRPTTSPTTTSPTVTVVTSQTTPITTSATAIPTKSGLPSGVVSCDGLQQWQAAFAYNAGARVIFNGQLYTATQWTYNNAPPSHPDQWTAGGTCSQPIQNRVDCKGVNAWQSNVAYTSGNRVTFNGQLWSAVQWTDSNSPGDTSGSWQNLGGCF